MRKLIRLFTGGYSLGLFTGAIHLVGVIVRRDRGDDYVTEEVGKVCGRKFKSKDAQGVSATLTHGGVSEFCRTCCTECQKQE